MGEARILQMEAARTAAAALADAYRAADPFPHAVIDDFIDAELLDEVLEEFPDRTGQRYFDRAQERYKFQFSPNELRSPCIRALFQELNGAAMLQFLSTLTGIPKLLPDPYFAGGGLHETLRGGHLSVHADFNVHRQLNLQRRLNLLVYLNRDWPDEYGGALELWDRTMTRCVKKVPPLFGRAVVFTTDSDSFHGHPEPLTCADHRSRRSIALYYYTAPEDGINSLLERNTVFKERPGSHDRRDREVASLHFINDWTPPRLRPLAMRIHGRLFSRGS